MSAMPLTIASLKSARHCVVFQLLKPIGGVRARPLGSANAGCGGEAASVINPAAAPATAAVAVSRAAVNAAASLVLRMGAPVGGLRVLSALSCCRLVSPELPRRQKSDHSLLWIERRSVGAGDVAARNVT